MESFELVEGRIVLLQIAESEYRPAIVAKVWNPDCANLVVFLDGTNDTRYDHVASFVALSVSCIGWVTSRIHGHGVGQWITPRELAALRNEQWITPRELAALRNEP